MPWPLANVSSFVFNEAMLLLHAHDKQPFHNRVFSVLERLFRDSRFAFELFGKNGAYLLETPFSSEQNHRLDYLLKRTERVELLSTLDAQHSPASAKIVNFQEFLMTYHAGDAAPRHSVFRQPGNANQLGIPLRSESLSGGVTINRSELVFTSEEISLASILAPQVGKAFEVDQALIFRPETKTNDKATDLIPLHHLGLSQREEEVMKWLMKGKRDAEIGVILGTSVRTINGHVRSIFKKLSVETRTAAVTVAVEQYADRPNRTDES